MNDNPNGKAVKIAKLETHMQTVENRLDNIIELLENKYVRVEEFKPIKKIVYGIVALALTGMFTAILSLVITN